VNYVENLTVFKRAKKLAVDIYKTTETFPKTEIYGLISQMRRAVVSINSNLMEGGHRNTDKEYNQFIGIARGSAAELKFQLMIASDLGFMKKEQAEFLLQETQEIIMMLIGLSKSIK
jgi:four helix bundle protein